MAKLTYDKKSTPLTCTVSPIVARQGKGSDCCEGLFLYEPVYIDFGQNYTPEQAFIMSDTNAIKIETAYETIWLLDIKSIEWGGNGKFAIKFEKCIIL
jgi:hypothetical protein